MRKFIYLVILTGMFSGMGVAGATTPSDWDAYMVVKEDFYFLDQQDFEEISCRISVPTLQDVSNKLKEQLAVLGEKVKISSDLTKFTLKYSPQLGVRYIDPKIDIELVAKEGFENSRWVERGVMMTQEGITQVLAGIKTQVNGIFNGYVKPTRNLFKDLKVVETINATEVTYKLAENDIKETYADNRVVVEQTGPYTTMNVESIYQKSSNGKYILENGQATATQTMGDMSFDIRVEYQDIKDITFPRKIIIEYNQNLPATKTSGDYMIELDECTIM